MAKTKEKDLLIDQLLAKVEEKKKQIEKIKNPVFKTNLSFSMEVFGSTNRINLNVASEDILFSLLVYLETMIDRVNDIAARQNVTYNQQFNGFKLTDWYDDILLMIRKKQSQNQVSELRSIESKLNSLISEDKKKDIELQNLSKLLA